MSSEFRPRTNFRGPMTLEPVAVSKRLLRVSTELMFVARDLKRIGGGFQGEAASIEGIAGKVYARSREVRERERLEGERGA